MKSSAKKVELASVDDLFTTEQERQQAGEERVVRIPLSQLHYFKGYPAMQTEVPFAGQPYRVKDDDPKMLETLDSVRQRGVRTPGLVRPDPDGGYEIISGHRRHRASELAGLEDKFSCLTAIKVSCLHFGQYSGKFSRTVSSRIFNRVLLPQKGHKTHSTFIALYIFKLSLQNAFLFLKYINYMA